MNMVNYGNDFSRERIDVQNRPQSLDLGSAHTSGTPETGMRVQLT
jgi:hypothetical protein